MSVNFILAIHSIVSIIVLLIVTQLRPKIRNVILASYGFASVIFVAMVFIKGFAAPTNADVLQTVESDAVEIHEPIPAAVKTEEVKKSGSEILQDTVKKITE